MKRILYGIFKQWSLEVQKKVILFGILIKDYKKKTFKWWIKSYELNKSCQLKLLVIMLSIGISTLMLKTFLTKKFDLEPGNWLANLRTQIPFSTIIKYKLV